MEFVNITDDHSWRNRAKVRVDLWAKSTTVPFRGRALWFCVGEIITNGHK